MSEESQENQNDNIRRVLMAQSNPAAWHTVLLCSPFRTECGYCHGDRLFVLDRDNPHPSPPDEPSIKVLPIEESGTKSSIENDDTGEQDESKKPESNSTESSKDLITSKTTSDAYALHFKNISPQAYLTLINQGWRRSGKLLYLPKNWQSCCAAIPIRLETSRFRISKNQKKVLKRLKQTLEMEQQPHDQGTSRDESSGDRSKPKASSKFKRQKQQYEGKEWIRQIEGQARELLQEHGLQTKLQKELMAQVSKIVSQREGNNKDLDKMLEQSGMLEKLCSFKCAKFSKPRKLSSINPQLVSMEVTLSNVVCPALQGRSNGQINRLAAGNQIVEAMRKNQADNSQTGLHIKTIDLHEKSAHINIVVDATFEDASMQISSPNVTKGKAVKKEAVDAIAEYIKSVSILSKSERDALSPPYRLTVRSISSDISGCMPKVHRLHCKYQQAIHGDEDPYDGAATNMAAMDEELPVTEAPGKNSVFSDDDISDDDDEEEDARIVTEENFAALYPQFDGNQIKQIHKSYNSFHRFLCTSPLQNDTALQNDADSFCSPQSTVAESEVDSISSVFGIRDQDVMIPYGSYHQHYLINDKYLIAVGVVDVLPDCLSSVYSFYDPKLSSILNLGKLTALYEIEWVTRALRFRPNLKYYYLGYYIHSCQKMRYKAEYKPSELLCPGRGKWTDFEDAKVRLEARSPIRNCCNVSTPDEEYYGNTKNNNAHVNSPISDQSEMNATVENILFDIGAGSYLTITMVTDEAQEIVRPLLEDFVKEIGHDVAAQCIVKLCG